MIFRVLGIIDSINERRMIMARRYAGRGSNPRSRANLVTDANTAVWYVVCNSREVLWGPYTQRKAETVSCMIGTANRYQRYSTIFSKEPLVFGQTLGVGMK